MGSLGTYVNQDFESVYHVFEKDQQSNSNKLSFVGINTQGYFFGEKQSHVDIIKTIIPEELLFKNQLPTFAKLKLISSSKIKKHTDKVSSIENAISASGYNKTYKFIGIR